MLYQFLLFSMLIGLASTLDCTQIPNSQISDGNTVYIPGPSSAPQPISANFNCLYNISIPVGLYANVTLFNGLQGVNDFILVIEVNGAETRITNRSISYDNLYQYFVLPGSFMTFSVITKSVFMNSKFSITVDFHTAKIGPNFPMKTGGEMNYLDVTTFRNNDSLFSSVTFTGEEPIHLGVASSWDNITTFEFCYIIDGTIGNMVSLEKLGDSGDYNTESNSITIVTFSNDKLQFVLNPVSEAKQFTALLSTHADRNPGNFFLSSYQIGITQALQVVNFDSTGITLNNLEIASTTCQAYIVSGPPNNSSKILLDLSTNPKMPYSFDLKYLTILEQDCVFYISVSSKNS